MFQFPGVVAPLPLNPREVMRYYLIFLFVVALSIFSISQIDSFNRSDVVKPRMLDLIEARYDTAIGFLHLRNIEELELRLKYDRLAASSIEKCHSNSFSVEYSPLSDFPKKAYERLFAIGLRRDIKRIKARIEYEREHSLHPFSLISGGCISTSDDDD